MNTNTNAVSPAPSAVAPATTGVVRLIDAPFESRYVREDIGGYRVTESRTAEPVVLIERGECGNPDVTHIMPAGTVVKLQNTGTTLVAVEGGWESRRIPEGPALPKPGDTVRVKFVYGTSVLYMDAH